jgi:hypothetical protein
MKAGNKVSSYGVCMVDLVDIYPCDGPSFEQLTGLYFMKIKLGKYEPQLANMKYDMKKALPPALREI